jgi:Kef-type K+ transport system membrane component KefB
MTNSELLRLLVAIVALLGCATLCRELFTRFRLPGVIGEIAGGVLLGPTLLGLFAPQASAWLFPKTGPAHAGLEIVYQLGLLMLMFVTGTRMRAAVSREILRSVSMIAVVGMVVPFLAGLALTRMLDLRLVVGPANNYTALTLVIAIAIAITSIPVISRIMNDLGISGTRFAQVVLAVAVLEDIVLNVVTAIALGMVAVPEDGGLPFSGTPAVSLTFHAVAPILVIVLAWYATVLLRRRAPRVPVAPRGTTSAAVIVCVILAAAACCLYLGITPMYGAFVVGLVSGHVVRQASLDTIDRFSSTFFIPVYFAAIGARLDLVDGFDITLVLGFVLVACVVKAGSVYYGSRAGGESVPRSVDYAVTLNARGGPGIVLAGVAFEAGIVNVGFFATLVLTSVITSLIAGSWLGRAVRTGRIQRREHADDTEPATTG